jgi:hypothetical protein
MLNNKTYKYECRKSSVCTAMSWTAGFRLPADFLFPTVSRTALGLTQPPIQWVTVARSPWVKRPEREAGHSPPFSAEAKNNRAIPPLSDTSPWFGA